MDPGTALAVIQFADQCIKYGQKLVRRCQNYRHAEDESRQLIISIEHNWMKTEAQISFLKRISQTLDPHFRDVQSRILSELEGKLKTATLRMDQLIVTEKQEREDKAKEKDRGKAIIATTKALEKMKPTKKIKYAFEKESLENIRDELESWQRRFDPSWMLTMRIADRLIDQQLDQEEMKPRQTGFIMAAKGVRDAAMQSSVTLVNAEGSIFKTADVLDEEEAPIPYSSAVLSRIEDTEEPVLVDTMICNPNADFTRTTKDVRNLARILSNVDPSSFGLLTCRGVVKSSIEDLSFPGQEQNAFKFLFAVPPTLTSPKSLRSYLMEGNPSYPLNSRFDLAKQLTNSVLFVHSSQFVHKNIRPETIIVFEKEDSKRNDLGGLFLVGFEKFRPSEGITVRTGDGLWQHDLYHHPNRQGTRPEEDYQMPHDIYSLGVNLLELGLWSSFITYPPSSQPPSPTNADAPPPLYTDPALPIPPDFIRAHLEQKDARKRAHAIKAHLIALAARELPARMGRKYTDIVLLCLRCLDKPGKVSQAASAGMGESVENLAGESVDTLGEGGWGEEGEDVVGEFRDVLDEDGIIVGVKYIEKVLLKMQEISI